MYVQFFLGGVCGSYDGEVQLGGDVTVVEPTAFGCTTLDGAMSFLDSYYRWSGCCEGEGEAAAEASLTMVEMTLSWSDADQYCQESFGSHLASIHSADQNELAFEMCQSGASTSSSDFIGCWIGTFVALFDVLLAHLCMYRL